MQKFSKSWKWLRVSSDVFGICGFIVWGVGSMVTIITSFMKWVGIQDAPVFIQVIYIICILTLIGFVVWVIVYLLRLLILKLRWNKNAITSTNNTIPKLTITGQVESIEDSGYYGAALGDVKAEGNAKVLVKAVFEPVGRLAVISDFVLEVFGEPLPTEKPPTKVYKGSLWEGYFEIPRKFQITDISAHLIASVNGVPCYSNKFSLPFKSTGEPKL